MGNSRFVGVGVGVGVGGVRSLSAKRRVASTTLRKRLSADGGVYAADADADADADFFQPRLRSSPGAKKYFNFFFAVAEKKLF